MTSPGPLSSFSPLWGTDPPPTASALIRLATMALVGYSPIRLALMALASEPPRPTRARRSVGDTPQGGHWRHWIHCGSVEVCVLNCCMEKLIQLALTEPKCLREPKWLRPRRARAAGQSWIS